MSPLFSAIQSGEKTNRRTEWYILPCQWCNTTRVGRNQAFKVKSRTLQFYRVLIYSSAPPPFSRVGITPSLVLPQKSITRKPYPHGLSDKAVVLSRFEPSPAYSTLSFQHPLSNASSHPRTMSILNPAHSRHSRSSSGFSTYTPNSPPPGLVRLSSVSTVFPSQPRPVHQLFEPALPDELALTRYGEGLVVLKSFDDGWCLVARDTSRSFRASYLSTNNSDKVDIGLVPAWVFVERLEGNTITRPFRSTSVNALHLVQKPVDARNAVISWSYFG